MKEIRITNNQTIIETELHSSLYKVSADAELNLILLLGNKSRGQINLELMGVNASANLQIAIIGREDYRFELELEEKHLSPHTKSLVKVHSALFNQSSVNFEGKIVMPPGAEFSDARLEHHTLLLSEDAKTRTIPALEIEAQEVKASHAASLGKIDQEQIFYCQSRGFSATETERMLLDAFFKEFRSCISEEQAEKFFTLLDR